MDIKKVKILRERVTVSMYKAIELLEKYDEDIDICIQEFHNENIKEISENTECGLKIAREYYIIYNYKKAKAVEKINSREIIITTRVSKLPRNEIGFILCPENKDGKDYKTPKRNDVFIPTSDFDYVIGEFRSFFPLTNPFENTTEKYFSVTGNNYFDNKTSKKIVRKISKIETK